MTEYAERKEPVLTAMQVQEIIPNRFPISGWTSKLVDFIYVRNDKGHFCF